MVEQNLYRDVENGKIGGVCAGISDVYGIDVNILRILSIPFFGLYILAWIILPEKSEMV
jgi:phage shock protein C